MNLIWNMPKKPQRNSTLDRQKRDVERDEDITFLLVGQGVTQNVPHQIASEIKAKNFQEIISRK